MNDRFWMEHAYQLAMKAASLGEVPVGAVVVGPEQQCLGEGYNQVLQQNNPVAHAEMLAIQHAAHHSRNYRLQGATLYTTLEPCCMCAGAMVHARIQRVVFATRDLKAGAAGSVCNVLKGFPLNHAVVIDEGIMQERCAALLEHFFKSCRL